MATGPCDNEIRRGTAQKHGDEWRRQRSKVQRPHVRPPGQEFDQGPILYHTLSWLSYREQGKQESFAEHDLVSFCFVVGGMGTCRNV